jgi:peroxiredoxin
MNRLRQCVVFLGLLALVACEGQPDPESTVSQDTWNGEDWRVEIQLPDIALPVGLHISSDGSEAWFTNGLERVRVGELSIDDNQYRIRFPAFNNTIEMQRQGDSLSGTLTLAKRGYQQHMPVTATPDPGYRFSPDPEPGIDVTGRWQVAFTNADGVETEAIGEFDQQGSYLSGTFLTATGDYRYLEGEVDGRIMKLSTFDGAHAFVFTATMDDFGSLNGDFWSGTLWHETWTARRNFDAKLPDPYSLTHLKPGFETVEFTFPDLENQPVSLTDPKYNDKVVLVTVSGTWCPNCADEADFLSGYYRENRDRGMEVINLLFEHVTEFEQAVQLGRALVKKHAIEYDVLIAGYSDKAIASEALPMLNHVVAYPTMIFIDRSGAVRKIHTGFSGPGTGGHYLEFVREFNQLMEELLAEPHSELESADS